VVEPSIYQNPVEHTNVVETSIYLTPVDHDVLYRNVVD
jgi:hypothetical protein